MPASSTTGSYTISWGMATGTLTAYEDLDPSTAQRTLNNSIQSGRARYGLNNGQPYEFKYDNAGNWHGYPVRGNEVPTSVLRQWLKDGDITRAEYMRLLSGG